MTYKELIEYVNIHPEILEKKVQIDFKHSFPDICCDSWDVYEIAIDDRGPILFLSTFETDCIERRKKEKSKT